ncbi:MAG: hypothetical protein ACOC40_00220 [Thermoplasmatota archaeon]
MGINEKEDIDHLKDLMETLNDTIPELISGVMEAVYNAENSENLAKNTTKFYKELTNAGMEKEQAYKLTREYLKRGDVGSLVREVLI